MTECILVVEDEVDSQNLIRLALSGQFSLEFAGTAAEARMKVSQSKFDLILLDLELPDESGFDFYQDIRRSPGGADKPVIFLTADQNISSLEKGLSLGAEDYITKPFTSRELLARINSRIKRAASRKLTSVLQRGPLTIDTHRYRVVIQGADGDEVIQPTPHEFQLLLHLAQNPGWVMTRQQLIDAVWGRGTFLENRTVDKHISSLRKKLGQHHPCIRTVSNLGYEFVEKRP